MLCFPASSTSAAWPNIYICNWTLSSYILFSWLLRLNKWGAFKQQIHFTIQGLEIWFSYSAYLRTFMKSANEFYIVALSLWSRQFVRWPTRWCLLCNDVFLPWIDQKSWFVMQHFFCFYVAAILNFTMFAKTLPEVLARPRDQICTQTPSFRSVNILSSIYNSTILWYFKKYYKLIDRHFYLREESLPVSSEMMESFHKQCPELPL